MNWKRFFDGLPEVVMAAQRLEDSGRGASAALLVNRVCRVLASEAREILSSENRREQHDVLVRQGLSHEEASHLLMGSREEEARAVRRAARRGA